MFNLCIFMGIRNCFLQLIWTMKLLTLDQPADVRRCRVPFQKANLVSTMGSGGDADADVVKCILARRTDFSKEAILRMKIDLG